LCRLRSNVLPFLKFIDDLISRKEIQLQTNMDSRMEFVKPLFNYQTRFDYIKRFKGRS
jgi:hypothetical protein